MAIVPTRRPLLGRIRSRIKCKQLRFLIEHAERDLRHHQEDLARLPKQIELDRKHINSLTIALIRAMANL